MASTPTKIFTATMNGRQIDFYDYGGVPYPAKHLPVSDQMVTLLTIPSSQIFYLSPQGHRIPYLSLSGPEQNQRDVTAWIEHSNFPRVYAENTFESSGDPEIDIFSIVEGRKVIVRPEDIPRYLDRLKNVLRNYREPGPEQFAITPTLELVNQIVYYPFNPATNFFLASQLAARPDRTRIQEFLDERGIFHFSADDIVNLSEDIIFFYLTRFYGPPVRGNLTTEAIKRPYNKLASNNRAKMIADAIPKYIVTYRSLQKEFDLYFNRIVQNPGDPEIWQSLGATNWSRFYQDFFDYLRLIRRREDLPPLTLNTIKQLRPINVDSIISLFTQYTDQEILHLVGDMEDNSPSRIRFLRKAAEYLLNTVVFVMQPYEALLCNNSESVYSADLFSELDYPFLGRGSFAAGFDCYTVEELFAAWESQRDSNGDIVFIDPLRPATTFRVPDLRAFRDALQNARAGVEVPEAIIRRFNEYI